MRSTILGSLSLTVMLAGCSLMGSAEETPGLRKIAVLPVAYSDGAGGGYPCDLCPGTLQMKPATAQAARLATAFLYEEVARHPRIIKPGFEVVEPLARNSMRQGATELSAKGHADAVLVSALLELRPRVGSNQSPETPAGVVMYAALVESASGKVLWSSTFDGNETGTNTMRRTLGRLTGAKPQRWRSAEGYTEVAARQLVDDLVDHLGS